MLKRVIVVAAIVSVISGCGTDDSTGAQTNIDIVSSEDAAQTPADIVANVDLVLDVPRGVNSTLLGGLPEEGGIFWMEVTGSSDELMEVALKARSLGPLLGYAFHLVYDPELLEFVSGSMSVALQDELGTLKGIVKVLEPGRLTLASVRFLKDSTSNAMVDMDKEMVQEFLVAKAKFRFLGPGESAIRFDEHHRVVRNSAHAEVPAAWAGISISKGGAK
jgi:hypothetical protein